MTAGSLKIFCDGGARGNPGPAASAFVAEKNGRVIFKQAKYLGIATNNFAEYSAVILALTWLAKGAAEGEEEIFFILDSELVAKQLSGLFKIKNEKLRDLFFTASQLQKEVPGKIFYSSVPRSKNKIADYLVNKVLDENQ